MNTEPRNTAHVPKVSTVLLTGGRAPVTLELARSFHAGGYRVIVAESVRYHLCRVSRAVARSYVVPAPTDDPARFIAALVEIVKGEQVDVLLPTCEEIFYVALGYERLSAHCLVWTAPLAQLLELHDKWRFVQLADRLGLRVPPTRRLADDRQMTQEIGQLKVEQEWVLKPVFSRFASRVHLVDRAPDEASKMALLQQVLSVADTRMGRRTLRDRHVSDWIVQQRIIGRHLSTYSVAWRGELLAHTAYPCHYRISQGATVHYEPLVHAGALAWVRQMVGEIGFSGQIAFDFIETAQGQLYAIECNPRATSGIHLLSAASRAQEGTSLNPSDAWIQVFLNPSAGSGKTYGFLTPSDHAVSGMVSAGMLASGLAQVRSRADWRMWRAAWSQAKDVVFRREDWRPALEQLRQMGQSWLIARKRGITLTEAMTIDIEWNGER